MKKYCEEVGVFDSDDAKKYEDSSRIDSTIYELESGDWVLETNTAEGYMLGKMTAAEVAAFHTSKGIDIPEYILSQLE